MFNIFLVNITIVQSDCMILFQEYLEILAFCNYTHVHIYKNH